MLSFCYRQLSVLIPMESCNTASGSASSGCDIEVDSIKKESVSDEGMGSEEKPMGENKTTQVYSVSYFSWWTIKNVSIRFKAIGGGVQDVDKSTLPYRTSAFWSDGSEGVRKDP